MFDTVIRVSGQGSSNLDNKPKKKEDTCETLMAPKRNVKFLQHEVKLT